MKNAIEQNLWWYDFMDSGGCSEGVKLFKHGFGTVELSCPWLVRQDSLITSLQSIRSFLRR